LHKDLQVGLIELAVTLLEKFQLIELAVTLLEKFQLIELANSSGEVPIDC